jgi:hypothetical protein
MSALDTVSRFVNPGDVRIALRTAPEYVQNRDRIGAVVHDGLAAYDTYCKLKPYLFWGSLLGAAASAYYFNARGRKPDNREAMVLYGVSFAACVGTAWFTRPGKTPTDASGAPIPAEEQEDGALVQWMDTRVEELKGEDPEFADASIRRLVSMPGIKAPFQRMSPLIQAAVL